MTRVTRFVDVPMYYINRGAAQKHSKAFTRILADAGECMRNGGYVEMYQHKRAGMQLVNCTLYWENDECSGSKT